ncbi:hypothetical protein ASPWEDRAFT_182166 [Aspergillus wentii DTO 134E9]|uniref:Zn(2)-C6 fungal-type domain-containing protein n=1 Tax=Aspergillus wentii DTO 134E9 TaxID=1073089 RepID=A0A1L9RR36_ASPWE|nr:uncharacterized protein ASPWEDRAFT_182166 [Aspergillus wentii DTO 134E9]KAI9928240.1 hypothetical protein MW887_002273 [Aspergillus wentii]OJJ37277.1 hypothetical protein ASPWEDRAFT_182166 [Aspergillus wentii DTO 134E9]
MYSDRQRSRKACISCRERKRKCDGGLPCTYCLRNEHECAYEHTRRKKKMQRYLDRKPQLQTSPTDGEGTSPKPGMAVEPKNQSQLRLLEANSPAVFVRRLGLKMNPAVAPRLNCYAWNLGSHKEIACLPPASCITEILTLTEMHELASIYFAEVGPVYNFVDREEVDNAIVKRWLHQLPYDPIDSLLCGVAALGCVFGRMSSALETQLVHRARIALEHSSQLASPEVDQVVGWLLRVIYLRLTSSPHATWMASCTLMHMIETTKLHFEPASDSILAQSTEPGCLPERRRRIYCIAQLFNTWVSLDCGKSQVDLRGASSQLPETSWTTDQRELCRLSDFLTPKTDRDYDELETELFNLCTLEPAHPMMQLLQCNIGLCLYRRVRALGRTMSDDALDTLMDLADKALKAVDGLVRISSPWWHIVNIPFQLVCIFLVTDHTQSLTRLSEALQTLKLVADRYDTSIARESYDIAQLLVRQQRQRRYDELRSLDHALHGHEETSNASTYGQKGDDDSEGAFSAADGIFGSYPVLNGSLFDQFLLNNLFNDTAI